MTESLIPQDPTSFLNSLLHLNTFPSVWHGIVTTIPGTMKFFRRKDKRKNDGSISTPSRLPGFGSSSSSKQSASAYGGYGSVDPRPDSYRPFGSPPSNPFDPRSAGRSQPTPTRSSAALLSRFPEAILERIFTFVCPHSRDETYATCEQSSVEDGCGLCDLRDLAHCVAVCRRWKGEAIKLLYVAIAVLLFFANMVSRPQTTIR